MPNWQIVAHHFPCLIGTFQEVVVKLAAETAATYKVRCEVKLTFVDDVRVLNHR